MQLHSCPWCIWWLPWSPRDCQFWGACMAGCCAFFLVLMPSSLQLCLDLGGSHSLFHPLPWCTCAILCMRPLLYRCVGHQTRVCVLTVFAGCWLRCMPAMHAVMSLVGSNMCSYYACVVHVMWDCNNYSAAVHACFCDREGP